MCTSRGTSKAEHGRAQAKQFPNRDAGIAIEVRKHPADHRQTGRENPGLGGKPQRLHGELRRRRFQDSGHR